VAVGTRKELSRVPTTTEWMEIYQFADKQALVGVMFGGIETLSGSPLKGERQQPPMELLMDWLGQTEYLRTQNELVNQRAEEITQRFAKDGMRSVVLKGQANSVYYPRPELRTPGDVDLWVEGDRDMVARYVMERSDYDRMQFHHIDYEAFPDIAVEVHFRPMVLFNYWKNERYQRMFHEDGGFAFQNWVTLEGGHRICVLPNRQNLLMQLAHMYRHVFDGGVGLRQVVDFYLLLQWAKFTSSECVPIRKDLQACGLDKFCGAIIWMMQEVFGSCPLLICEPDERRGRSLLDEMLDGGNFGHHKSEKKNRIGKDTKLGHFVYPIMRNMRLLTLYPSDCMWNVIYRLAQFGWRKRKGWK
jgi:hypothetical protein